MTRIIFMSSLEYTIAVASDGSLFRVCTKTISRSEGGRVNQGCDNEGIQLFFLWEKVLKWREIGGGVSEGPK